MASKLFKDQDGQVFINLEKVQFAKVDGANVDVCFANEYIETLKGPDKAAFLKAYQEYLEKQ